MGVQLIVTAILLVVSLAASYYLASRVKPPNPLADKTATTLAERGAFVPWVLGRRRVGAVVCWAGDRFTRKETVGGGGKGSAGKKPKQTVYFESAMHVLCVGPAFKLHRIWADGKVIFKGTIDSQSHPSGSTIDVGSEGAFDIYWGEHNQPTNAHLGHASRVGVTSRWPHFCYVVWRDKRLGTAARWPFIDYEIETRVFDVGFSAAAAPWFEATRTLSGSARSITAVTNGAPGTCKITLAGNRAAEFPAGSYLKIAGNGGGAAVNRDWRVHKVAYAPPVWDPLGLVEDDTTDIFLDYTLAGATASGTAEAYVAGDDDGVNPAHALAYVLFGRWPQGCQQDPAEFDLSTLDAVAQVLEDEKVPCAVLAPNGDTAMNVIAQLMQDHGILIGWDVARGKYVFRAIRQEAPGAVVAVPDDLVLDPKPEATIPLGERNTDQMVFSFNDRARNFKEGTIEISDDSEPAFHGFRKPVKIAITTVISHAIASKIAERRMQEELAGRSSFRFQMNRGARLFVPGTAFTVEGFPYTYRVIGTAIDTLSGRVQVQAILDVYGSKTSSFSSPEAPAPPAPAGPAPDLAQTFVEIPGHVSPGVHRGIVPRIRAHGGISGADIWFSRDGVAYTHVGNDDSEYTGGLLDAELTAAAGWEFDQGPTITALGPDIGSVLDLSADVASWRAGRQIVIIGDEIFFLKKVTSLGGGQYRLDGLIRARFDTPRATHPAGSAVFIFTSDVQDHEDTLLVPEEDLYVKPQPKTGESLPLSQVPPIVKTLVGKGIAPMPLVSLSAGGPVSPYSNGYRTGEAIAVRWSYRSLAEPRTGAGMQGAGVATAVSPVEGEFVVRIETTGGALKREVSALTTPAYSYPNATLVSDFAGEPAEFVVKVKQVKSGLSTPWKTINVKKAA